MFPGALCFSTLDACTASPNSCGPGNPCKPDLTACSTGPVRKPSRLAPARGDLPWPLTLPRALFSSGVSLLLQAAGSGFDFFCSESVPEGAVPNGAAAVAL